MKSFNKKRIKLTIIVSLILVNSVGLLIWSYNAGKNKKLDAVILNNNKGDSSMFAIMVEQGDGIYEDAGNSWPADGSRVFNEELSACIDTNGNTIKDSLSYDEINHKVILRTQQVLMCYLYFSYPAPDITVTIDNTKGSQTSKYKRDVDCGNTATATFNPIYQRIEIGNITSPAQCTLNYIEDTKTHTTLISEVESKATEITDAVGVPLDATYTTLTESEYINITNDSEYPYVWNEETSEWVQTATVSKTYSYFKFYPNEEGGYQVCYTLPASASGSYSLYNSFRVYLNSTSSSKTYINSDYNSGETKSGCYDMQILSSSDYIYISGYYYDQNISFSIKKTTELITKDVGYRYTGRQPNNWVWFNGEKWRIIGSMPTTLSDGTETNLVKIMRNEILWKYEFDRADSNVYWGTNSLYTLLNSKYYGKEDATGTNPCVVGDGVRGTCNYKKIGISSDAEDYYGKMVKDVYWNVGEKGSGDIYISTVYVREGEKKSSVTGKVGLMNASDYGYAASGITYNRVDMWTIKNYASRNWILHWPISEWTLTPSSSSAIVYIYNEGSTGNSGIMNGGNGVRPVVYLDASVYVVSGDGTEGNPYQIGMY